MKILLVVLLLLLLLAGEFTAILWIFALSVVFILLSAIHDAHNPEREEKRKEAEKIAQQLNKKMKEIDELLKDESITQMKPIIEDGYDELEDDELEDDDGYFDEYLDERDIITTIESYPDDNIDLENHIEYSDQWESFSEDKDFCDKYVEMSFLHRRAHRREYEERLHRMKRRLRRRMPDEQIL